MTRERPEIRCACGKPATNAMLGVGPVCQECVERSQAVPRSAEANPVVTSTCEHPLGRRIGFQLVDESYLKWCEDCGALDVGDEWLTASRICRESVRQTIETLSPDEQRTLDELAKLDESPEAVALSMGKATEVGHLGYASQQAAYDEGYRDGKEWGGAVPPRTSKAPRVARGARVRVIGGAWEGSIGKLATVEHVYPPADNGEQVIRIVVDGEPGTLSLAASDVEPCSEGPQSKGDRYVGTPVSKEEVERALGSPDEIAAARKRVAEHGAETDNACAVCGCALVAPDEQHTGSCNDAHTCVRRVRDAERAADRLSNGGTTK